MDHRSVAGCTVVLHCCNLFCFLLLFSTANCFHYLAVVVNLLTFTFGKASAATLIAITAKIISYYYSKHLQMGS